MCIAVHPDDETLGCGGTILKHIAAKDKVSWLIVTDMKNELGFSENTMAKREVEIRKVKSFYKFCEVTRLGLPTTCLDMIGQRKLVGAIFDAVSKFQPEVLYLPFYGDAQSDHRMVFEASISCLKSFRCPSVKKALMMETPSETDYCFPSEKCFSPNYYVDITDTFEGKLRAMKIYESEYGIAPFPRSKEILRAFATLRGSFIGRQYAEAFVILKDVWI